MNLNQT